MYFGCGALQNQSQTDQVTSSLMISFLVLECAIEATGGEKSPVVLFSPGLCMIYHLSFWQDMSTCVLNGMTVMRMKSIF